MLCNLNHVINILTMNYKQVLLFGRETILAILFTLLVEILSEIVVLIIVTQLVLVELITGVFLLTDGLGRGLTIVDLIHEELLMVHRRLFINSLESVRLFGNLKSLLEVLFFLVRLNLLSLHQLLLVRGVHLWDLILLNHRVPFDELVAVSSVLVELVHVRRVVSLPDCCLGSSQHEVILVFTGHSLPKFFDSVGIPESVQGVFAAGCGGGDVANHHTLALPTYKGVFQDEGQFVLSERHMSLFHV